jgi:hypothetical protein
LDLAREFSIKGAHMPEAKAASESDPRHHVARLKQVLNGVATHAQQDSAKVSDPRLRCFLRPRPKSSLARNKAFDDMEKRNEAAWR